MNRQFITYRCVNSRAAHNSKGHQNSDGIAFGHGKYHSNFSFESACEDFRAGVYYKLKDLLDQLTEGNREGERLSGVAVGIHRKELQEFFHKASAKRQDLIRESHTVCWCCLFETPQHALSCGHVLCTPCLRAYGRIESRTIVRIHECPFESSGRCQPRFIYIRPETAGLRILVLDEYGQLIIPINRG
jgi:hypothetical protein